MARSANTAPRHIFRSALALSCMTFAALLVFTASFESAVAQRASDRLSLKSLERSYALEKLPDKTIALAHQRALASGVARALELDDAEREKLVSAYVDAKAREIELIEGAYARREVIAEACRDHLASLDGTSSDDDDADAKADQESDASNQRALLLMVAAARLPERRRNADETNAYSALLELLEISEDKLESSVEKIAGMLNEDDPWAAIKKLKDEREAGPMDLRSIFTPESYIAYLDLIGSPQALVKAQSEYTVMLGKLVDLDDLDDAQLATLHEVLQDDDLSDADKGPKILEALSEKQRRRVTKRGGRVKKQSKGKSKK